MTRTRSPSARAIPYALLAVALLYASGAASAQDRPGFLDNLFSRGEPPAQEPQRQVAQGDPGEMSARIGRLENALRQLTGRVEELQYQNQQLRTQLQQMGGVAQPPAAAPNRAPMAAPPALPPAPAQPGQRGDAFDPARQPNAPGAPRALGGAVPSQGTMNMPNIAAPEIGAPDGRDAGAPLDLGSLAGVEPAQPGQQNGPLPPPARNTGAAGTQLATLPPSASPKDQYDLAYGYVLRKDYGLAQQAFQDFLRRFPSERLVPDAQYWLGESLFQQQNYTEAARHFLNVATKFEGSSRAPEALLRLGQSLAALNKKEAACATLAEVGRKFPRASANVKRGVAQEQTRARC